MVKILVRGGFRGMGIKGKSPGHMDFVRKKFKTHLFHVKIVLESSIIIYSMDIGDRDPMRTPKQLLQHFLAGPLNFPARFPDCYPSSCGRW